MTIPVRTLADDVWTLLSAVPNLNTWRGEILDAAGQPTNPPVDPDGRVHPYAVAYFGGGQALGNRIAALPSRVSWSFQVTCVGGDDIRCMWAVDTVRAALSFKRVANTVIRESTDPGPIRRSDDIQPSICWVPVMFTVNAAG